MLDAHKSWGSSERHYATIDHDAALLLAAVEHSPKNRESMLGSGSIVLTLDGRLCRFERERFRLEFEERSPIVARPEQLIGVLRPFINEHEDEDAEAVFLSAMAVPEIHIAGTATEHVAARVAQYLATYSDLSEETALKILSNVEFLKSLRHVQTSSPQFGYAVASEIIEQNAALRVEVTREKEQGQAVQSKLRSMLERLESSEEESSITASEIRVALQIMNGGMVSMGDININNGNAAVVGAGANVSDVSQSIAQGSKIADLAQLAIEFAQLKSALASTATSSQDYEEVASIAKAVEAAEAGNEQGVVASIKSVGRKAIGVARDIGVDVAAEFMKQALGM